MQALSQERREVLFPPCPECDGSGESLEVCHVCSGAGGMWIWGRPKEECIECGGTGIQPCWRCAGLGTATLRVRNLTPHPVTLWVPGGYVIVPPDPAGPARCKVTSEMVGLLRVRLRDDRPPDTIPLRRTVMGEVEGLPEPEPGVVLIVSRVVAEAARDRHDLLIVDDTIRDEQGRIVAARALAVMP